MKNRELRTFKRQRKIRNELILLGMLDALALACMVAAIIVCIVIFWAWT